MAAASAGAGAIPAPPADARSACTSCSNPSGSAGCARTRCGRASSATPLRRPLAGPVGRGPRAQPRRGPRGARELESIDPGSLSEADRLNRELFARLYREDLDAWDYGLRYLPVTQRRGVQSAHELAEQLPFATVRDFENWIARLEGIVPTSTQTVALMPRACGAA